ncbi:MAG: hypothetical protein K5857_10040, partial [Lachnospiraceae bacterium]|nr:hypothetical protein [Lachnospiraceae bacterium]
MGGIALLTAYGEYFSLFAGVSLAANIILIIACIIFFILDRKKYGALKRPSLKEVLPLMVAAVPVILVCAYFTAAGSFTYDTGTYHAQSIHWIETYGLVKGLAHMQTRLAFNSAYFSLCALYSFSFLGRSMHVLSGFLGAFLMVCSLRGLLIRRREDGALRGPGVSDLAYMAPFGYFLIIAVEIISPSTDHGTIWLILWLL